PPDADRGQDDILRVWRDVAGVHAHSASRSRPRAASVLSVAAPAPVAGTLRRVLDPLPEILSAEPGQPALRLSSPAVVRAEPPGRGFRRDFRGVADAPLELAQALRRMARAEEAAICQGADGRDRREKAGGHAPAAGRAAEPAHPDARRALRKETGPLRDRLSEDLRPGSSPHLLRRSEASPLAGGVRVLA